MEHDNIFASGEESTLAVLVSLITPEIKEHEALVSLEELERLLETAGGKLFATVVQQRSLPDGKTYVGKGKLCEIASLCHDNGITLVVFDCELSPAQIKNIEDGIRAEFEEDESFDVRVIDRSMLILDIFALHAASAEGKLQVELAQIKYTLPRLMGKGKDMSRLGGGIGTRGPGESKLENDRRQLRRRIESLERQIAELERARKVQRSKRDRSGITKVAIVGYTNAGKSTLLNCLTDAGILAQDKLFATLDPTTRLYKLPSGREILLTDTVGFIRRLPHHLVSAFKSTLDELRYADAVIIVIDASDPEAEAQLEVTEKLIFDLGVSGKPTIYVMNKCDICDKSSVLTFINLRNSHDEIIPVSALNKSNISALIQALEKLALNGKSINIFMLDPNDCKTLAFLYKNATVENVEYTDNCVAVAAVVDEKTLMQVRKMLSQSKNGEEKKQNDDQGSSNEDSDKGKNG